jgi:CelD/BcsL family acetyltransferase involved in cellulose biosynthesis
MNAVGGFPAATYAASVEGFAQVAAEWQALSLAVERPSCFATPAYFQAWRDTLADDVSPFLLIARQAGRLAGVMPMMRARVRRGPLCAPRHDFAPSDRVFLGEARSRPLPVRQLSPVVSMPASWTAPAPLCHAMDREAVIRAMARHMAGLDGWDSVAVPVDAGAVQDTWLEALDQAGLHPWVHALDRRIGAIGMVESFAAKAARQGSKFRQNIRRAQAAAQRVGLSIAVHEGQAARAQLPVLAAVAMQSWKQTGRGQGGLTVPYTGRQQAFTEHLLGMADEGMPVLTVASCHGAPVAVLLSLLHGSWLTALLTFRNDRVPEASPGMLVFGHMIDWVAARGLAGFDLNASHEWARHLIDDVRHQNVIVGFAPTWRGQVLRRVSALARRVR